MFKSRFDKLIYTVIAVFLLSGCGASSSASVSEPAAQEVSPQLIEPVYESGAGKVRISEIMSKNKATLRDSDGDFSDWFELENLTSSDIDLSLWSVSDDDTSWTFPSSVLGADSRVVVFASKKDRSGPELHTNFALSEGETVSLFDANGDIVSSVFIEKDKSDCSLSVCDDGSYTICKYPTPGLENTKEAFALLQSQLAAAGPLVINEVCVDSFNDFETDTIDYPDWVEIKNISDESVDLSRYRLSDDPDFPDLFTFPNETLQSGDVKIVLCDKDAGLYSGSYSAAPFSINSENDRLFLSRDDGTLIDYVALRDVPYLRTYGRIDGQNGFFYLDERTPGQPNSVGLRFVSDMPVSLEKDGVFDDVSSVRVSLSAPGDIYYTLDSTVPTLDSSKYMSPIELTDTTVVRAIAVEPDGVPSRTLTLSYIINEDHDLPVVSLVSDDKPYFNNMYSVPFKGNETPGCVSYYGDDGSFTIGCGIKMHGFSTLNLFKPNLSLRFRGCYGQEELNFDLFGGGETTFTNLLLRGGGDQINTIVRNEALMNLAMNFSDSIICQRNKYCVLYIDGKYTGIHALMEKTNEQLYASCMGVSKDSVIENEATVYGGEQFYIEVIDKVLSTDLADDANYQEVCKYLDIDSFIDWCVFEGWTGNNDLASGNLRYYKSTEGDGKWRLALYDLDNAFLGPAFCFSNVISYVNQVSVITSALLENPTFRDKFLSRAAEAFQTTLTDDAFKAEFDRLCAQIDSEVDRDGEITMMNRKSWESHVDSLYKMIDDYDWTDYVTGLLCEVAKVKEADQKSYFGKVYS